MNEHDSVEGRLNPGPEAPPSQHPRPAGRTDQVRYSDSSIDRLVEAGVWEGDRWRDLDHGSWLDGRAEVERTGNVEWEGWLEVLDVERAVSALRTRHPEAALAVTHVMLGGTFEELQAAFREMSRDRKDSDTAAKRAELALESGKRWMATWLSTSGFRQERVERADRAYRAFRRNYGRKRA
jgi:hypothetical protein